MATVSLIRAGQAQTRPSHNEIRLDHLYRAHIEPRDWREPEQSAFVEAISREGAVRKISAAVSALEFGSTPEQVAMRIYNTHSALELIQDGCSDDDALKLFEVGWSGDQVIAWVQQPLFLLREPAALIYAWARIPQGVRS